MTDIKLALREGHIRIGDRLRLARNLAGLTQSELGAKLGVSFQQVQKYERGVNGISAARLQHAAVALAQPLAWFFEGPAAVPASDREALRLAAKLAALPEPQRASAIRVLEIIVATTDVAGLAAMGA